jgi:plasmid maintenance system antidote protein VapI
MSTEGAQRALKAVERLMKAAPTGSVNRFATRMHRRLTSQLAALPMSEVVNKVPGTSFAAKARNLGVTRQTVYAWVNGDWRPDDEMAKKLETLTGFSADAIRGRGKDGDVAKKTDMAKKLERLTELAADVARGRASRA